jgi:predicted MFS family arabinose efflux permease
MPTSIMDGIRTLRGSPRELWFVYVLYIFAEYTYHAVGTVLASYATTEFGYSDVEAGALYGTWGVVISFWHFVLGSSVDALGIKKSLLIGFTFSMLGRALLTCATQEWHMLVALYGLGPLGEALASQTFQIGVCRYTHAGNQGVAFALLYSALNFGGAVAGFVIDLLKTHSLVVYGQTVTGYRLVLFSSLITATICFFGVLGMRDGVSVDDLPPESPTASPVASPERVADKHAAGDVEVLQLPPNTASPQSRTKHPIPVMPLHLSDSGDDEEGEVGETSRLTHTTSLDFQPPEKNPLKILTIVLKDRNFWRFVLLNVLIIPAALPVKYNNVLMPKYLVRQFGNDVPFGSIISINWVLCIFFSPVFGAWTKDWQHLDAIRMGTIFTGFASAVLVLDSSLPTICAWEVIFTIGECLYASRKYALAADLAPKGMEATFVAVAGLPGFVSTFPSGLLSGWLLDTFVPMCKSVTDFTAESFCSHQVLLVNETAGGMMMHLEACMSPNLCERGSGPRDGDPCVCDVLVQGECNYLCKGIELFGAESERSVVAEGQCPTICEAATGYEANPRQMWLMITMISITGPLFIGVLCTPILRPRRAGLAPPITFRQMCAELMTACIQQLCGGCSRRHQQPKKPFPADRSHGGDRGKSMYAPVSAHDEEQQPIAQG